MADVVFEMLGSLCESSSEGLSEGLSESSCEGISESTKKRKGQNGQSSGPGHTTQLTADDLREIPISK